MAISYEKATSDFEALLAKDADTDVTRLAKELLESSRPEVKGAACLAIAKLRLKTELMLHGPESQVFAPANEALKLFRESSEKHGEASALNTVAQAYLVEGDVANAISSAKESNRIAVGLRDKSVAAAIQGTLCQAYVAQGDQSKATQAAKERVSLLEAAGSQDEAALRSLVDALSILADMQLNRGMKEASRVSAEKMAKICEQLGDTEKQAKANKSLSLALVKSGKAEEAPNRAKAIAALERAMAAAERKSEADFKKWWYEVESLGGVSEKDIRQHLGKLREHDIPGLEEFLRDVGAPFAAPSKPSQIDQFTKRYMYIFFRTGGIQYGPRYQCVSPYRVGEAGSAKALSHLRPSSESEAWELMLGYHTGILDGSLQSGSVQGAPNIY
jgi:hypothetical protein